MGYRTGIKLLEAYRPVTRRGIIMTTRSTNRFAQLRPDLAEKLGVGFRAWGREWTVWFPPKKEWEDEIIRSLTELKIPFRITYAPGPRYIE